MRSERVSFLNRRGERLSGRIDLPDRGSPAHYAVFAHCFTCTKDFKLAVNLDRELTDKGIAVLRFDFTGLGQSEGSFTDTNFSSNADDVVSAAVFLTGRGAPPGLLIGHSLGGTAMLCAAPSVPSSVAVVTIATPSEPRHLKTYLGIDSGLLSSEGSVETTLAGKTLKITKQFVDDLDRTDMNAKIEGLNRAILVFHSPQDRVVGIENALTIFQHARQPKSFVSLDGADHLLLDEDDARYVGALTAAWALRYLVRM